MNLHEQSGSISIQIAAIDFDVSRDFYCKNLDFIIDIDAWIGEGVIETPFRRTRLVLKGNESIALEFVLVAGIAPGSGGAPSLAPFLTFTITDLDDVQQRFESHASAAIVETGSLPYGRYLTVCDPNGNQFQLFEPYGDG